MLWTRRPPQRRTTSQGRVRTCDVPEYSYHLAPIDQNMTKRDAEPGHTTHSPQILDTVSTHDLNHLPLPCLPTYFVGRCRGFFESGDDGENRREALGRGNVTRRWMGPAQP